MANLPRFGRTWQRFSSLPRPATASQPEQVQPATEPEISPYAPPTTQVLQTSPIRERSSRVPSPTKKFPSPPSSPKYRPAASAAATSPPKPLSPTPTYSRYNGERRTSAPPSPKPLKSSYTSPPLSPAKQKYPTAAAVPPLSPLTLPRSEAKHEPGPMIRSRSPPEVEEKSIHYPKTTEKPTKPEHRQSEYISGKPHQKQQQSDVITIKGENVGAIMHITQSSDGTDIVKKKPISAATTGSSHESGTDEKANNKSGGSLPAKSFMNSNFQGVNNSILYNSSFSHRDPGLHLSFSKKPTHGHGQQDVRDSSY